MSRPQDVLIVYDEAMLAHDPTGWDPDRDDWTAEVKELLALQFPEKALDDFAHPERPERLSSIVSKLQEDPIPGTRWVAAEPAEPRELTRVHSDAHVAFIESLAGRACWLDVDTTAVSPASVPAAKLAAGAGVTAVEALLRGEARRAFCAVRPPGHHALSERAMGFCLYNNVAVTAGHARALGLERVMIWDWDLHHGNGTQAIFDAEPSVLFVDTHCEAPFYPGTGALEEIGSGAGTGTSFNVPLPLGSGNAALVEVAERIVRPAAEAFRPDLILLSAGFDPHHLDDTFAMDEGGFAVLTAQACEMADALCEGRLIVLLEGGYDAESISASAHATVGALAGDRPRTFDVLDEDPGLIAVNRAVEFHQERLAALASLRQRPRRSERQT